MVLRICEESRFNSFDNSEMGLKYALARSELILTGLAEPVSFRLMVQSMVPRLRFLERIFLISNSKGFKKAGILRFNSNCLPLSDFISIRKVLSPTACSTRPKPVIDFSIYLVYRAR